MRRRASRIIILMACVVATLVIGAGDARADAVTEAGDVIQILLPAGGWLYTFVAGSEDGERWDREGTRQGFYSILGALATTRVAKVFVEKLRPDGGARSSYPSGHTTGAFAGAVFLDHRYGWKFGLPAYAGAGFVGYTRVRADKHFADDVTAGASIALMFGWLFVRPRGDEIPLLAPVLTDRGLGLRLNPGGTAGATGGLFRPRYSYTFAFGPSYLVKNQVRAPNEGGTDFDLNDFDKIDDPTSTAAINFDMLLRDRQGLNFYFNPYESRDRGRFSSPVEFAGVTFPADTTLASAWRLYDLRAAWHYDVLASERWLLRLGIGAMYQHTNITLLVDGDESTEAEVSDQVVLPYLTGTVEYSLTDALAFGFTTDGSKLPDDWLADSSIYASYRFGRHWTWYAGYQFYGREISTQDMVNRVEFNVPHLAVSYGW